MLSPSQLQQGSSLFFTLPGGHGALPYTPLLHMLSFLQMLSVFSRKKEMETTDELNMFSDTEVL